MSSDLTTKHSRSYAFGAFVLLPERQLLLRGETPVRIGGRALDILTTLVERPGQVVSKSELIARVWPNTFVNEGNLKVNVAALRRALGDGGPHEPSYIATASGQGYRFIAPVTAGASREVGSNHVGTATRRHNLPTGTTRILGRADVIDAIRRDLDVTRLVTIVGPGGVGKTTVALAVAEHALDSRRDGVWLVDFAPLTDPAHAINALATTVGVPGRATGSLAALCEFLRDREMLIVLDNCEHIIDVAASCASQVLADASGVKILVTSREPLQLAGERVRRLPGLGTPPASTPVTAQEALTYPAVQLFVDRATDRLESFTLSDANTSTVADICRRLDGIALAIELAATRVDTFGAIGLLQQLDDRFGILSGFRASPERHRTLAATLDWSYGLLSPTEATVLRAVSVFSGVFDLDDASAVSNLARQDVGDALVQLAAKSLVVVDVDVDIVAYRLLETTRAYCLERRLAAGDDQAIRQRHAEQVCVVLERATAEWAKRPAHDWVSEYGRVLDDLRHALVWAGHDSAHRALRVRLTVAGLLLWNHFSLTEECRAHVSQAIEDLDAVQLAGTASEMHLRVWLGASTMFTHGLQQSAMDAMRRALEIAAQIGDTGGHLRCLRTIGLYQHLIGEHVAGLRTFERFATIVAETDPSNAHDPEFHLSISEYFLGRLLSARTRLERLVERAHDARRQSVRYQSDINIDITCALTVVQWLTGAPDAAALTATALVERALRANHHMSLNNALNAACPVFYWSGRFDECDRGVAILDEEGRRHGIVTRRPIAMFYRAALTCADTGPASGIDGLERAIAEFRKINHLARMPYYLGVLAEAQATCGRVDQAKATIRTALDLAQANSEGWCLPEVQRVYASILLAAGGEREAEACLRESIAQAGTSGALSWRLRSATDLARLWAERSRTEDAANLLRPIYAEFTEGFGTRDVVAARTLLASLSPGTRAIPRGPSLGGRA